MTSEALCTVVEPLFLTILLSVTDLRTYGPTDLRTDTAAYRDAMDASKKYGVTFCHNRFIV